ncbi:MAG: hypothetical protein IH809_05850, partial [Proteobacteria bacterium]|nr:hypothetical protein [Pseudomonadota bacterium]
MASSAADLEAFRAFVCERFGIEPGGRIVVGASGGLDSTVLLRLLHGAGFITVAAHVNYGLRGAESDGDEAFGRAVADEHRLAAPDHGDGLADLDRVSNEKLENLAELARANDLNLDFETPTRFKNDFIGH